MVRIINYCYSNLNYENNAVDEVLGDDITNEITIGTSPINLLSTTNLNRKLIKIYTLEFSNPSALIWIKHSTDINFNNASFSLPVKRLYENTSQAARPLSVFCSEGTALIRLTTVNKV